jgi:PTS system glucose-specific IIA component
VTDSLTIAAPFTGTVVAMSHVPDEVFAQEIVGPGVALEPPAEAELVRVHAPISGTVAALFPHAFSIDHGDGRNVLVHLGIDTVSLQGAGFTVHTSVGARVEQGDLLIEWAPQAARAAGLPVVCPVVAVQCEPEFFHLLTDESVAFQQGVALAQWHS